ncbi:MAG: TylF/MycF/NovP-related O-methyltransferase [Niabella sp.]
MHKLNNFFITEDSLSKRKRHPLIKLGNKLLSKRGYLYRITPIPNPVEDMNTIEQRINFFHLLGSVIENRIEGDIVELGCFTGQCALLFQKILDFYKSDKDLHLYDSFETKFTYTNSNIEDLLIENFEKDRLKLPNLHKGFFNDTLPAQLPEKICFAHIDCGFGGDKFQHKEIVLFCLEKIYTKMPKGAVCVLMDYFDATTNDPGLDCNPGVKLACDDFFKDKQEVIVSLYGNQISHAYFKKL